MVARAGLRLRLVRIDGDAIYWSENRPEKKARRTIMRWTAASGQREILPPEYSARSRVHEGGGGEFWVADGIVYFVEDADQRVYRMRLGASPEALTPPGPWRYADGIVDARRGRLLAIREDHSRPEKEARNEVVAIAPDRDLSEAVSVLVTGSDFYAAPRLNGDGTQLAYLSWEHPRMPWDGTELWVANVAEDGTLKDRILVAGGPSESIFQPEWAPDGRLYFVSDRTGWWNLYRARRDRAQAPGELAIESIAAKEAEFGVPMWSFSKATYGFASADDIVASYVQDGVYHLAHIDATTQALTRMDLPFSYFEGVRVSPGAVAFVGGSATRGESVVALLRTPGQFETSDPQPTMHILRDETPAALDTRYISTPESITYPTSDGARAHAHFYPPRNPDHRAPAGSKPPLMVVGHGGPTSLSPVVLRARFQYWTSRGFAILDVNYRGSTGYGRAYRTSLYGKWGIDEVQDSVHGARYLVETGRVDGRRMVMRGGSAGGFSTLNALAFHDVFRAGGVYYGVSDLALLFRSTHKFESRYLEQLIGPYPAKADVYRARSALFHTDKFDVPVIFFHGAKDAVVPIEQAELMVERLRERNLDVEFLRFADEYHGFQQADSITRSLAAELAFYRRVLDVR